MVVLKRLKDPPTYIIYIFFAYKEYNFSCVGPIFFTHKPQCVTNGVDIFSLLEALGVQLLEGGACIVVWFGM